MKTKFIRVHPCESVADKLVSNPGWAAAGLCVLAFVLRAGIAWLGPSHFWVYTDYFEMARNVVRGVGYCLGGDGTLCAYFPPVYPTVLAAGILTGHAHAAIALAGSLAGAGTVGLTYLIGRRLFGSAAGLAACAYAAVYPYYVWHDGVLQESATLAFVVAGAMWLLLDGGRARRAWVLVAAGGAAGLTVLTKANLALFLVFALAWSGCMLGRRAWWVVLGAALVVGPWLARTWRITGEPIIYSNAGFSLWTANHRLTFDYFPGRRIDDAGPPEWADLSAAEQRELESLGDDPHWIKETHWLWGRGMAFIRAHPWLTLRRAVYKVWIGFSPWFSPEKGWLFEAVYFVSYAPVLALGCWGAWRSRGRWREMGYIYGAFAGFAMGTAVFWAHTSHRMYLEPYLMIWAASVVVEFVPGVEAWLRSRDMCVH